MNGFPILDNQTREHCFREIVTLYSGDLDKLLIAAEQASLNERSPFRRDGQDTHERLLSSWLERIKRTAGNAGQRLLIKWMECLYEELLAHNALGVTKEALLSKLSFAQENSEIYYADTQKWVWHWILTVEGNSREVAIDIRKGLTQSTEDIVPEYVLQYIRQAMNAFNSRNYAVSLALMTIALEGTLRDALTTIGYTYSESTSTIDQYEIQEVQVSQRDNGYFVTFPQAMSASPADDPGEMLSPTIQSCKIKRVVTSKRKILQIEDCDTLLDRWSSNRIVTPAVSRKISGLGNALQLGRQLHIIAPTDLPTDLDEPIKIIRNNLIHLSGEALTKKVTTDDSGNSITLEQFLKDKNRVFDTVCTIGDAINTIYNKITPHLSNT